MRRGRRLALTGGRCRPRPYTSPVLVRATGGRRERTESICLTSSIITPAEVPLHRFVLGWFELSQT